MLNFNFSIVPKIPNIRALYVFTYLFYSTSQYITPCRIPKNNKLLGNSTVNTISEPVVKRTHGRKTYSWLHNLKVTHKQGKSDCNHCGVKCSYTSCEMKKSLSRNPNYLNTVRREGTAILVTYFHYTC
jgi:hypothetical protein